MAVTRTTTATATRMAAPSIQPASLVSTVTPRMVETMPEPNKMRTVKSDRAPLTNSAKEVCRHRKLQLKFGL